MYLAEKYQPKEEDGATVPLSQGITIGKTIVVTVSLLFLFVSFNTLFLPAALRGRVGTDYGRYQQLFYSIGENSLNPIEKNWLKQSLLFLLINKIVYFTTKNYLWVMAVFAFIIVFMFIKAIVENSINWTYSLFVLLSFCLYYQSFNQIRQIVAISIIMLSFKYLKYGDNKKFIISVFFAALFHLSALIFIIMLPVKNIRISKKLITASCIIGTLFYVGFNAFFSIIVKTGLYSQQLTSYEYSATFTSNTILNFVIRIMLLAGCLFVYKETTRRAPYTNIYYLAAIICTILQIGAIKVSIFGRVTTYFYVAYIFLLPEVIKSFTEYFRNEVSHFLFISFMTGLLIAYHFVYYYSTAVGSGYSVYRFFWQ